MALKWQLSLYANIFEGILLDVRSAESNVTFSLQPKTQKYN